MFLARNFWKLWSYFFMILSALLGSSEIISFREFCKLFSSFEIFSFNSEFSNLRLSVSSDSEAISFFRFLNSSRSCWYLSRISLRLSPSSALVKLTVKSGNTSSAFDSDSDPDFDSEDSETSNKFSVWAILACSSTDYVPSSEDSESSPILQEFLKFFCLF